MTNNAIGTSVEYPVISDGRKREGRGERGEPGEEVGTIKLRRRRQDHLKFCTHKTDDALLVAVTANCLKWLYCQIGGRGVD